MLLHETHRSLGDVELAVRIANHAKKHAEFVDCRTRRDRCPGLGDGRIAKAQIVPDLALWGKAIPWASRIPHVDVVRPDMSQLSGADFSAPFRKSGGNRQILAIGQIRER